MKIGYFPGCSAGGTALEYGQSVMKCAELLDIELVELEDWNCCGASSGHSTDEMFSLALPARNIAIAEQMDLPITVCCAACYLRLKNTEYELKRDPGLRKEISEVLDMPLEIKYDTLHFLEIIYHQIGLEKVKQLVQQPLSGLKAACYYGCYLVRPAKVTRFDNPENPTMLDEFITAIGAEAIDFPAKVDCCSGGLSFTRVDMGKKMVGAIHQAAVDAGANCIVAACPKNGLPTLYFSELLALALGETGTGKWWKRHIIRPNKLLKSLALI